MRISSPPTISAEEVDAIQERLEPYAAIASVMGAPQGSRLASLNAAALSAPKQVESLDRRIADLRVAGTKAEAGLAAARLRDSFGQMAASQAELATIQEALDVVEAEAATARATATQALEEREAAWGAIVSARTCLTAVASGSAAFLPASIERRTRHAWAVLKDLLDPIGDRAEAA